MGKLRTDTGEIQVAELVWPSGLPERTRMISRLLVFGDDIGVAQLLRHLSSEIVCGIVAAEIRPHQHSSLRDLANKLHLPFIIQPSVVSTEYLAFVERVASLNPDLILVNSYSMLLRPEILAIPLYGAVNIHGALLPQYRGANPVQWALLNDETETGVTMHYMDEHFDTGDVIAQRHVPIYFEDTWQDVQTRIYAETEKMLAEELPKLLAGTNTRRPQDESRAHSWHRRHPEDGLIDWQQSVRHIYNLVRALVKPHPGAFYQDASGKRVILDEYLTIPQVTALKYGSIGKQVLSAKHVILAPLNMDEISTLASVITEHDQVPFNAPYKPVHNGQHTDWFESIQKRNNLVIFSIRLLKDNTLIGLCQLHSINYIHRSAELQIRLGEVLESQHGYGTEAIRLLLNFAFKDLNLNRVYLHVSATNAVALQTYQKVGFVREGLLRQAAYIDNRYVDVVMMGILRNEYVD